MLRGTTVSLTVNEGARVFFRGMNKLLTNIPDVLQCKFFIMNHEEAYA